MQLCLIIKSVALAALAVISILLSQQVAADAISYQTMRFDRLGVSDGLSQNSVMAITQDQHGFLWFATERGLSRYDGYRFKTYRHERGNADSLSNDFARDFSLANDGSLWIATDGGGVSKWDPQSDSFMSWRHDSEETQSIATDRIRTILSDPRGYVWIGTRDAGLDRLNMETGEITHYTHSPQDATSISHDEIYALTLSDDGVLWIGTKHGLNRLQPDSGNFERFTHRQADNTSLADNHIRSLLVDGSGSLWVGTNNGGLHRFDSSTNGFVRFRHDPDSSNSINSNRIERIFQDDINRIWVGTDRGLNLMNRRTGTFRAYENDAANDSSLNGNYVFSIFQDRGGIVWIGTRTGGLSKWNPRSWSFGHYKPSESEAFKLTSTNITSFAEDASGRLWAGTFGGGINVIDRNDGSIRYIQSKSQDRFALSDDRVMALLTDSNGQIWAGTMTGGLNRFDPKTGETVVYRHDPSNPKSLAADGIMSLYEDRDGRLWVGTFGGGVSRLVSETGEFVTYSHHADNAESLSSNRATSIAQDGAGAIWVGTDGGGLNRLNTDGKTWIRFAHDNDDATSLSSNTVYALHIDSAGLLWIATRAGLDSMDTNGSVGPESQIANVTAGGTTLSQTIYSLSVDNAANLWMGTAGGLVRYDPAGEDVRYFHENNGLQGEEFNFGASYVSRSGILFFGGANGFNQFDPKFLEFNDVLPPIMLTSLSIHNVPAGLDTPIELITEIDLTYNDNSVTFEFSALDFESPQNNRYSYRLDGFDDVWVDAGNERRITYTNLDGGDYLLRVRAATANGSWNESGFSIPIRVAIPPWETWWAYSLYVMAILLMAVSVQRQHQRSLARKAEDNRRLEQTVRQRTKELKLRNEDLRSANDRLLKNSTTDPLTGLRNRRYLFEKVVKDVDLVLRNYVGGMPSESNDLLFLMVDIDNFKGVNDAYGHEAGDSMLLQVRDVLLECCRISDDIIRWGGDEFLIVARETDVNHAEILAERIRSKLAHRVFQVGGNKVVRSSASVGFASFPFLKATPDLLVWEEVLGIADIAMYASKKEKNSWLGIRGTQWSDSGTKLYEKIREESTGLAMSGAIKIVDSASNVIDFSILDIADDTAAI